MQASSNIFTAYGDKSGAKRGFGRTFKDDTLNVDSYLDKVDGKWGFYKDADGKPVLTNQAPEAKPADLNVLNDMAPAGAVVADQALEAAKEEITEDTDGPVVHDAFSNFAMAQLTAGTQAAAPAPAPAAAASNVGKIQKDRAESNGVKRPSEGTVCAAVWDIATGLSNPGEENRVAKLSEVVKAAEAAGINKFTARTQYARWRVFHGVTGRGK